MTPFQKALAFTLQWEGGYSNHPADKGGATMKGITQKNYSRWRASAGLADADVKGITTAEVEIIYQAWYWAPIKGDALPTDVAMAVFDWAVNSGPSTAIKGLQRAVGTSPDGVIGPKTLAASMAPGTAIEVCDQREAFIWAIVARDASQSVFVKGWLNRINSLRGALYATH